MSRATRLAAADTRFVSRDPDTGQFRRLSDLARGASLVPGGLGFTLPTPITVCGVEWVPADGSPWGSPIGACLAAETAGVQS